MILAGYIPSPDSVLDTQRFDSKICLLQEDYTSEIGSKWMNLHLRIWNLEVSVRQLEDEAVLWYARKLPIGFKINMRLEHVGTYPAVMHLGSGGCNDDLLILCDHRMRKRCLFGRHRGRKRRVHLEAKSHGPCDPL